MPLPPVTSGLQFWFDARDITGVPGGSTIATMADSSGNSHTATVATGTATYQTAQYNGGAAIVLASCKMTIAGAGSIPATDNHTIIVIAKLDLGYTNIQPLLGGSGGQIEYWMNTVAPAPTRLQGLAENGGFGHASDCWDTGTALPDTNWHQMSVVYSGSIASDSCSFTLDGAADADINNWPRSNVVPPIWIGTGINGGFFFTGRFQVIGYYNRLLSPAEIAAVFGSFTQPKIFVVT